MDMDIPLVLAGYSPGQPEPERMLYEFSRNLIENTDWTPPELRTCGHFSDEVEVYVDRMENRNGETPVHHFLTFEIER